jgi:hypothetical protein
MMMSRQKKITYIVLIVVLIAATITVIIFGRRPVAVPNFPAAENTGVEPPGANQPKVYVLPKVFPAETGFNTSVFNSSTYQTLQPPPEIKIEQSELGRENPFKKY